jgi:hypothetical protein
MERCDTDVPCVAGSPGGGFRGDGWLGGGRGRGTFEAVPLHTALEPLSDADSRDVYVLPRDKMPRAKERADLEPQLN